MDATLRLTSFIKSLDLSSPTVAGFVIRGIDGGADIHAKKSPVADARPELSIRYQQF